MNVANIGMTVSLMNVSFVVILGLVLGLAFWGLDSLVSRFHRG